MQAGFGSVEENTWLEPDKESDEEWLEDVLVSMDWLPTYIYAMEVNRRERAREATIRLQAQFESKCLKRRRLTSFGGEKRQGPCRLVRPSLGTEICVVRAIRSMCVVVFPVVTGLHVLVACVSLRSSMALPSFLGSSAALIELGFRLG